MRGLLKKVDLYLGQYINLMAFVRTFLSILTAVLSVAIFLEIFGYVG